MVFEVVFFYHFMRHFTELQLIPQNTIHPENVPLTSIPLPQRQHLEHLTRNNPLVLKLPPLVRHPHPSLDYLQYLPQILTTPQHSLNFDEHTLLE